MHLLRHTRCTPRSIEKTSEANASQVVKHVLLIELTETNSVTTQHIKLCLRPPVCHNRVIIQT